MATKERIVETKDSLQRMQDFRAQDLAREDDLGRQFSFAIAVSPAERLISLYRRVPVEVLEDLTESLLAQLKNQADADYNRFKQIIDFSPQQGNAPQVRDSLIQQINMAYDAAFNALWQFIAFSVARITDTSVLENQARATLQGINDSSDKFQKSLQGSEQEAQRILQNIKAVAAEQGVSQQAEYFKGRADDHTHQAEVWRNRALIASAVLLLVVIASLFLHKWEWFAPKTNFEAAQYLTSKIFLFAIIAYWVLLSAKNFLSHEHNAVVNRHRQTALQTYRVLADAAGDEGSEDIVLAHAAACIFGPQDTGFSKVSSIEGGSKSVLELLTKTTAKSGE